MRTTGNNARRGSYFNEVVMMATVMLKVEEVMRRTGLSHPTIYAWAAKGMFPKQVKIGLRAVAWIELEIEEWLQAKITERGEG